MKKHIIAIAAALMTSFPALAGVFTGESENDSFTCDVRLGCNFSNIYANLNSGSRGRIGGLKAGFSGSVNCRFYAIEGYTLAIESGLGIQQRGSKDWTLEGYANNAKYETWYLELPLLASVKVVDFHDRHMGFLEAGVYGGYGIGGKMMTTTVDEKGIHNNEKPIFGDDGIMIRGDFGLILGISAIIADNFMVTFRYQQSFIPLAKGEVAEYGKFYNNGFSIRFGILL